MTRHEWANRPHRSSRRWIHPTRRLAIYMRDDFTCVYCQQSIEVVGQLALDHLMPRKHGGTDDNENLVTSCHSCNSSRQDRPWQEFADPAAQKRIKRQRRRVVNIPKVVALLRSPYR